MAELPKNVWPIRWLRYCLCLSVALVPALMALLTWDIEGSRTQLQSVIRFLAVPVLLMEILTVAFALRSGFQPLQLIRAQPRWMQWALVTLLAVAFGTAFFVAPAATASVIRTYMSVLHLLFGLSAAYLLSEANLSFGRSIWRMVAAGACLYLLLFIVFVAQVPRSAIFDWEYLGLGVMHIRLVGFYAAVGAAAAVGLAATAHQNRDYGLSILAATLMIALASWTGSRGALVAIGGSFLVGAALVPSLRTPKAAGALILSTIVGILLSLIGEPPHRMYGLLRMAESIDKQGLDAVGSGRLTFWLESLRQSTSHILFGHGEDQFRGLITVSQGRYNHPHNIVVQILLQWGLVGAVCFFSLGLALFWAAARRARDAGVAFVPPFLVLAALLTFSLYDGTLYHPYPTMMIAFCFAFLLGAGRGAGVESVRYIPPPQNAEADSRSIAAPPVRS